MDRYEPRLAELRPPNPQDPLVQIHVLPIECHHFADAHTGDREQSEDCRVSAALQSCGRSELTGCPDEIPDFHVAVNVRPLPDITARQQAGGRHFRASIRGTQPDGKTAHHPKARSPGRRLDARGLLGPAECQVRGDMGSPFPFGKGQEVLQQAARVE
jgi:hypothetical protein